MRGKSPSSIADRIKNWRANLISNPSFQRFCTRFWPTRKIAQSNAASVFDLCAGFVYSQILFACVELDLLSVLRDENLTSSEVASRVNLPPDAIERLLKAATSLDILEERSQGRYGLGQTGAAVLGSPGLQGMIQHHEHLYRDLAHPLQLLSGRSSDTALAKFWHYSRSESQSSEEHSRMETYSELMRETQSLVADEILSSYSFNQHKSILDVGGGDGRFLRAVHTRAPQLNLNLLELPTVAKMAEAQMQEHNISASVHEADMFDNAWPQGADLICLVRVALDHDDEAVTKLFSRARQALPPEGVLLVAEPMSDSPKVGHAYFGMYLWAMGSGRARTSDELRDMLRKAGFSRAEQLKTGLPDVVRIIKAS